MQKTPRPAVSLPEAIIILAESEYDEGPNNFHLTRKGDEIQLELTYPDLADGKNNHLKYIYVNQESVHASDGIRLHYDYQRRGFVIEQASIFHWDSQDTVQDADWQEVAFIKSWARHRQNQQSTSGEDK